MQLFHVTWFEYKRKFSKKKKKPENLNRDWTCEAVLRQCEDLKRLERRELRRDCGRECGIGSEAELLQRGAHEGGRCRDRCRGPVEAPEDENGFEARELEDFRRERGRVLARRIGRGPEIKPGDVEPVVVVSSRQFALDSGPWRARFAGVRVRESPVLVGGQAFHDLEQRFQFDWIHWCCCMLVVLVVGGQDGGRMVKETEYCCC